MEKQRMSPEEIYAFCKDVLADIAVFHYAALTGKRSEVIKRIPITRQRVSQVIAELEMALAEPLNKGKLITHKKRGIIPSDAGDILYRFTTDLVDEINDLQNALYTLQHDSQLRLAIIQSAWVVYGPQLQQGLAASLAGATIKETVISGAGYMRELVNEVRQGRADAAITSFPPDVEPPLVFQPFQDQQYVAVFSPAYQHLPKRNAPIEISRIVAADPMLKIAMHKASLDNPMRNDTLLYLRKNDAYPGKSNLVDRQNIEDIKAEIKAFPSTMGILPINTVDADAKRKLFTFFILTPPPPPWPWGIIYRSGTSRDVANLFLKSVSHLFKVRTPRSGKLKTEQPR